MHVVTTTSEQIIIHNRAGVVLSTVPLNSFWSSILLGGSPPTTFDPKILYDRFNDRFIFVVAAKRNRPLPQSCSRFRRRATRRAVTIGMRSTPTLRPRRREVNGRIFPVSGSTARASAPSRRFRSEGDFTI